MSPVLQAEALRDVPTLAIVVPCFNEDDALKKTNDELSSLVDALLRRARVSQPSRIIYVDDGSTDTTWEIITTLCAQFDHVCGLRLTRNCGHQNALLAGLLSADSDTVVSIDADLQDDISKIEEMLDAYAAGAHVVYGVRTDRHVDSWLKKTTAESYYRILRLLGVEVVFNHADFRLMSREAIAALEQFREVNVFLRGLVPLLGFPSATVAYARQERVAGQTKYSVLRMMSLAWEGITSLSIRPLRAIAVGGALISMLSICAATYYLWVRLFTASALPGWASIVLPVYILGGLNIFCIGVVGEYIGKIYMETKARPRYLIQETINLDLKERGAANKGE